jgi:hypothetical protein
MRYSLEHIQIWLLLCDTHAGIYSTREYIRVCDIVYNIYTYGACEGGLASLVVNLLGALGQVLRGRRIPSPAHASRWWG